jgi:hypothetical protein
VPSGSVEGGNDVPFSIPNQNRVDLHPCAGILYFCSGLGSGKEVPPPRGSVPLPAGSFFQFFPHLWGKRLGKRSGTGERSRGSDGTESATRQRGSYLGPKARGLTSHCRSGVRGPLRREPIRGRRINLCLGGPTVSHRWGQAERS